MKNEVETTYLTLKAAWITLEEGSGLKRPFGYYAYFATCK